MEPNDAGKTTPEQEPAPTKKNWEWKIVCFLVLSVVLLAVAPPAWKMWLKYRDDQYLAACQDALEAENWELLEVIAENWHNDSPENGYPWLYRADAAVGLEKYEAAAEFMGSLPEDDPKFAAAMLKRIDLQFSLLNDPLAAEESCKRLLKVEPRTTDAHQRLIFFYAMTYQRTKLVDAIHFAMEKNREPKEAFIYLLGKNWLFFSNGYDLNQHWLEAYPDEDLFHLGRALSLLNTPNPAIGRPGKKEMLEKCASRFPKNIEVSCYRIEEAMKNGDDALVAQLLNDLSEEDRDDNRIWKFKGWLEQSQGDYKAAIASYQHSLQLHRVDWSTQFLLSEVYRLENQPDEARKYVELADVGKRLERTILELPDVNAVSLELIVQIAEYFKKSGDSDVSKVIFSRIGP